MSGLLHLKNGTDVRGTAEGSGADLTEEAVYRIARAFVRRVKEAVPAPVIAVGHDPRTSSGRLAAAVAGAIRSEGAGCLYTGLSSTPSMFMLLKDGGADASVMITASHLPGDKNGLKFFTREGGLESEALTEVLLHAEELSYPGPEALCDPGVPVDYLGKYAADLVALVRRATGEREPLLGKRILVDAGNGAGGFYAKLVLQPLGADTAGSQFLEPDGNFPNHIPNPENEEAMASVCAAVKRHHADLGIIFDTDVDRAGAVSSEGEEINRNRLIALISAILLKEHPGAVIVTDSVTSTGLSRFIAAHGGVHRRFKRGYKNVINESKRLNAEGADSPLAIETSGHAAFRENDFLDDGAYLVTRLLIALAGMKEGRLTDLIKDLPEPKEACEIRLKLLKGDPRALGERVLRELKDAACALPGLTLAPDNCEGVRICFDRAHGDGWALVRMSLHEPILPINAESDSVGGTRLILSALYSLLRQYDFLDAERLKP